MLNSRVKNRNQVRKKIEKNKKFQTKKHPRKNPAMKTTNNLLYKYRFYHVTEKNTQVYH